MAWALSCCTLRWITCVCTHGYQPKPETLNLALDHPHVHTWVSAGYQTDGYSMDACECDCGASSSAASQRITVDMMSESFLASRNLMNWFQI